MSSKSDITREMLKVKDTEINQLMETIEEVRSNTQNIINDNRLEY